jgi:hypothetical protein
MKKKGSPLGLVVVLALGCLLAVFLPTFRGWIQQDGGADGDVNLAASYQRQEFFPRPQLDGWVDINGIPARGQTLTADVSGVGGKGAFSYQWYLNDGPTDIRIEGANGKTLLLNAGMAGKRVSVVVARKGYSGGILSPDVGPVE